jgi:hypothetical protein
MNGLMKRLHKIQDECVDKQGQPVIDETMDEFTRLKKKLAFDVKSILSPSYSFLNVHISCILVTYYTNCYRAYE